MKHLTIMIFQVCKGPVPAVERSCRGAQDAKRSKATPVGPQIGIPAGAQVGCTTCRSSSRLHHLQELK